jgi:hypothetical protein
MLVGRSIGATSREAPMDDGDRLASSLQEVKELEQFLFTFIGELTARAPRPGDDVSHLVDEFGLQLPGAWRGEPILWAGGTEHHGAPENGQEQSLVLVRPGNPAAVGFTVGCITVRGRRYCLECGWLYCRIVIRF